MNPNVTNTVKELATVKATLAELDKQKAVLEARLIEEAGDEIASQLDGKDYGAGTVNLEIESFKVKLTYSKKIEYDQAGLETVAQQLAARGEDPKEYIKTKLDVSETAYKNWPSSLQALFQAYRTVKVGKPTISIEA